MARPDITKPEEREGRLPAWARSTLEQLRMMLADERSHRRAEQREPDCRTQLALDWYPELGRTISFSQPKLVAIRVREDRENERVGRSAFMEFRQAGDGVEVRTGEGCLLVVPIASNAMRLERRMWP